MKGIQSPIALSLVLLGMASSAFLAGAVLASNHPIFSGMDPRQQAADSSGLPENHMSSYWVLTPTASANVWFANDPTGTPSSSPTITPIAPLMKTAVAAWTDSTDGVEELVWEKTAVLMDANVVVSFGECDDGKALGSFAIPSVGFHHDHHFGANYWDYGRICLSNVHNWQNQGAQVSTLAHEIGHTYGLDERYEHGLCNNSEVTIMDVGTVSGDCDNLEGPSKLDVSRVKELFKNGTLSDFTATSSGDSGVFTWKDNAWGERYHEVLYMYKLDWAAHPGEWEVFATSTYSADTGSHKDIAPDPVTGERTVYVFKGTISLTTHWNHNPTVALPDKSAYMACGRPFFQQFNTYGPQSCAEIIVDNSAHNAQIPTPRPTATLITLYDADLNGEISRDEVIQAIGDYLFDGLLIRDEVILIINLYLFG